MAASAKRLDEILQTLDGRLLAGLDAALNEPDEQAREKLNIRAGGLAREYLEYVQSDPVIQVIDDNPFMPVGVKKTLSTTLAALCSKLGA